MEDRTIFAHVRGGGDRLHRDDGAAAVEFALVLPILLVFVFGIINFGFVFSQQLTLNNAVREGARRAVVNENSANRTCQGILESVQNEAAAIGMDANQISVRITTDGYTSDTPCATGFSSNYASQRGNVPCSNSYSDNSDGTGDSGSVVVEAEYPSDIVVSIPPFPNSLGLSSKAVYRCEFS